MDRRTVPFWIFAFAACSSTSPVDGVVVEEGTSDGITVTGSYRRQNSYETLPTMLLIHEPGAGAGRHQFDALWESILNQGWNALAIDLRSHGDSDSTGSWEDLRLDAAQYPVDLATWFDFLADRAAASDPIDLDRIGVIGFGTGGSLGLVSVAQGWAACAAVVSARVDEYEALRPGLAVRAGDDDDSAGDDDDSAGPGLHDVLLIAGSEQDPEAGDAETLRGQAADPADTMLAEAAYGGYFLMSEDDAVKSALVAWCDGKL
jgi:pimeloyl-ACP methyl ester carboxylesterase